MTPYDQFGAQPQVQTAAPEGSASFLRSKAGKILLGLAVLVLLLALAAFAVFNFLLDSSDDLTATLVKQPVSSATPDSSETIEPEAPEVVAVEEVYTYRDIFEPTIVLASSTSAGSSSDSGGDTSSDTSSAENTLVLQDISTENGEEVAVLVWNGETYTLAEGEEIPGTPWKVLTINESSVVMQYGDQPITLTVGVGVSK
jgi:hypothetical protein